MSEDLLKALLGGMSLDAGQQPQAADPLGGLLGSMLGGAAQQDTGAVATDPLAGMLGSLLGGAAAQQGAGAAPGGADLGSLIGMLMGAGGGQAAQPQPQQAPGDLLGSLLGGGQAGGQPAGQLGGMGGMLQPILQGLAQNLGLSPQIAQIVVTFVLGALLTGRIGGASTAAGVMDTSRSSTQAQPLDLGPLLGKMASGQVVSTNYLRSTGMVKELTRQSGLDQRTATLSLQQVLGSLGGIMAGQSPTAG